MEKISYEEFKEEWLKDILVDNPFPLQKGRRFAQKLFVQWFDLGDDAEVFLNDGCGDGGIDMAYYGQGDTEAGEGNTWYIVQSKYGTSYSGSDTLFYEANKIFDTLEGHNKAISMMTCDIVEQVNNFRETASEKDKIVIVFATCDPLSDDDKRAINDIKHAAIARFGNIIQIESISVYNIYLRLDEVAMQTTKYEVPITTNLVPSGPDLLIGSTKLLNLYEFMKAYRAITSDLELIYEKNVRKFLGSKRKVNKGIEETLRNAPEKFGIYNNGITIVVKDFSFSSTDNYILVNPYIVNGCQTTRTIWDVLYKNLENVGTGKNEKLETWKQKLQQSVVVTKIVRIGEFGEQLLNDTTKYTNSQNAVSAKDFIALESNFQNWSSEMQDKYHIFLEIQRGAWDSIKSQMQKSLKHVDIVNYVTALDLLKVYAAAWMNEPGKAFGKTPPFAPGGSIFKEIMQKENFGVDDLYAAYLLRKTSFDFEYAKHSSTPSLGKGRYLLYLVIVEMIKECINGTYLNPEDDSVITRCVINIFDGNHPEATKKLYKAATNVMERYFSSTNDNSLYRETMFNGDINAFLKNDKIGKRNETPKLYTNIAIVSYIIGDTQDKEIIRDAFL